MSMMVPTSKSLKKFSMMKTLGCNETTSSCSDMGSLDWQSSLVPPHVLMRSCALHDYPYIASNHIATHQYPWSDSIWCTCPVRAAGHMKRVGGGLGPSGPK